MKKLLTGGLAALTVGAALVGTAAPASARDWDHRWGDDGGGAALAAGIAGLAVGAAIAGGPHYYYAPRPYYYGPSYYAAPAYYGYRGCRVYWRWSPYWGRYVRARACY